MAQAHLLGSILGTAVGDAIGLPYEGLSRARGERLLGPPDRHRLLPGAGMISDDTEHTCMVAEALIASAGEAERFRCHLARSLRWWLLALPAGVGLATLRALIRLWLGYGPRRSGVFSAGNGPAMRAAILGAAIDDDRRLQELVAASTRLTHTDPKAEYGALAVALAARMARTVPAVSGAAYHQALAEALGGRGEELLALVARAVAAAQAKVETREFAASLGLDRGVSGYVYHTVPVVIHAWLRHPRSLREAVTAVILCGGDADTTAAIVGGIVGAGVGREGIPADWLAGLREWPRSIAYMERLAAQLDSTLRFGIRGRPPKLPPCAILPRNLLFLVIVLGHGMRRLFPPY